MALSPALCATPCPEGESERRVHGPAVPYAPREFSAGLSGAVTLPEDGDAFCLDGEPDLGCSQALAAF